LCAAISLIKAIVLSESFGFLSRALDLCFQNTRKSSRCQRRSVSGWTRKSACFQVRAILARSTKKKPVCFPADGTFNLSTQDDELLPQQRVFRQQFGFASGQIGERAEHKRSRQWFDPPRNTFLECMQAETDSLLKRGKYIQHE